MTCEDISSPYLDRDPSIPPSPLLGMTDVDGSTVWCCGYCDYEPQEQPAINEVVRHLVEYHRWHPELAQKREEMRLEARRADAESSCAAQ